MKYLIILICVIAASCAREADIKTVPSSFVEKVKITKLMPAEIVADENVRAMTLLSYPLKKDVRNWGFTIDDETKDSWELFFDSLKFRDRLLSSFDKDMDSTKKIQEIVTLVNSAGESRDQAYKKIAPLKQELLALDAEMTKQKDERTPADLETIICYYAKKPAAGKNYECKTAADADFNKEKTAATCKDFIKFKFIDEAVDVKITNAQTTCVDLQKTLDEIKAKSKIADDQIASQILVRSAGESVVIDLLQSIEAENPGLVLIATGATLEKNKDPSDAVSKLVINKQNQVELLSLIIDFGPNLSSGSGKVEYSLENGKIRNLSFKKESDGVWTLKFNIVTSDFVVKTNLSYTIHPTLGMRFVGDANFNYPNGIVRKGVMKLEFDLK